MEKQVKARGVYLEDWSEEGMALLNDLTPDSEEFESMPIVPIEKFENDLVFEGQNGFLKIFPTQEIWERVKERRYADGDDEAILYYSAQFPSSEDVDDEVSVTFKIPKDIYNELKKITYFSGCDTMKSVIVEMIFGKCVELNAFLIDNKFNVDPGMWEISGPNFSYYQERKK